MESSVFRTSLFGGERNTGSSWWGLHYISSPYLRRVIIVPHPLARKKEIESEPRERDWNAVRFIEYIWGRLCQKWKNKTTFQNYMLSFLLSFWRTDVQLIRPSDKISRWCQNSLGLKVRFQFVPHLEPQSHKFFNFQTKCFENL